MFFLQDMEGNLKGARKILMEFGDMSGLRVNWGKSCLFPMDPRAKAPGHLGDLRWEPRCFKYLGVNIYHDTADRLDGNHKKAVQALKSMDFWGTLPLSNWPGRVIKNGRSSPRIIPF